MIDYVKKILGITAIADRLSVVEDILKDMKTGNAESGNEQDNKDEE